MERQLGAGVRWARPSPRATDGTEDQVVPRSAEEARAVRGTDGKHRVDDRLHHRLRVAQRLADDPQDLARGRALLERLFRLVEETYVLDGDDGLMCECLDELDLRRRERDRFLLAQNDRASRHAVAE